VARFLFPRFLVPADVVHPTTQSVAMKMSWMSNRKTTVPEDMSYSMLGILNINMPLTYGEGAPRAFRRMQEILLASPYMDESLFAWTMPSEKDGVPYDPAKECSADVTDFKVGEWGLLAGSHSWFASSGDIKVDSGMAARLRTFRMTSKGVEAPILRNVHRGGAVIGARVACSLVFLTGAGAPLGILGFLKWMIPEMEKEAKRPHPFVLNCFRLGDNGQRTNIAISLQAVVVGDMRKSAASQAGVSNQIVPYIECKRVECNKLETVTKKVKPRGTGIVYQPPPAYFSAFNK
jgi:hypothetical protein